MRHDWVFDVLDDLRIYALSNGLPRTAALAEQALAVARDEIALQAGGSHEPQDGGAGDTPPGSRSH
ncbi:MAG TPA: hypothetical protein VLA78_06785 [Paracoccaceae bacterium]|nr:hypothetical protein [Paracoccaceae bacterium]